MAGSRVIHGAKAKVYINDKPVGIFTDVSYSLQFSATPTYILGRAAPQEIVLTGQDAVQVTASGYRVLGASPHLVASVPMLQDIMKHEGVSIRLEDRTGPDGKNSFMKVQGIVPTGWSTRSSARSVQEVSVNFVGTVIEDESGPQFEDPSAASY